jgi:hypothetical protein
MLHLESNDATHWLCSAPVLVVVAEQLVADVTLVVPIPTLPFNSVMFEFVSPVGGVPESRGTVPVCAAAPIDANAKLKPSHMHADFVIFPNPFVSAADLFRAPGTCHELSCISTPFPSDRMVFADTAYRLQRCSQEQSYRFTTHKTAVDFWENYTRISRGAKVTFC